MNETAMFTALRAFLIGIVPAGTEVIQAQNNRVAEPKAANFIVMTPKSRARQATNQDTWPFDAVAPTTIEHEQSTRVAFQLDIHGPNGSDNAQTIATLWRDDYACIALAPAGIAPLYADDGQQMPFVNAASQYENRWVMAVAFQVNPVVSTPQQFADSVDVDIGGPIT